MLRLVYDYGFLVGWVFGFDVWWVGGVTWVCLVRVLRVCGLILLLVLIVICCVVFWVCGWCAILLLFGLLVVGGMVVASFGFGLGLWRWCLRFKVSG